MYSHNFYLNKGSLTMSKKQCFKDHTRLPVELWKVVIDGVSNGDLWSFLGLCKDAKEAVIERCSDEHNGEQLLNKEQVDAWIRVILLGQCVFLTGGAGVGKTHTLRNIADEFLSAEDPSALAIAAPTGAAARLASTSAIVAKTIHLLFNIRNTKRLAGSPPCTFVDDTPADPEATLQSLEDDAEGVDEDHEEGGKPTSVLNYKTKQCLQSLKLLIIDEVSMLSRELLELIDVSLQAARSSEKPFGGCVVLAVGDFFQLAPVAKAGSWAFKSTSWTHFRPIQLTRIIRQSDKKFAGILNRIRVGACSASDAAWIRSKSYRPGDAQFAIFPSNKKCKNRNEQMMARLTGQRASLPCLQYCVELISSKPWRTQFLRPEHTPHFVKYSDNPSAKDLQLKVNCRVRCTKNVYSRELAATSSDNGRTLIVANGQRGTVISIDDDQDSVKVLWDKIGDSEPEELSMVRECWPRRWRSRSGGKTIIAITKQFPLLPAFAITLHAAQGASVSSAIDIDHRGVEPDASGKWATKPASAYVALSRATSIENVRLLSRFEASDARCDPEVADYYFRTVGTDESGGILLKRNECMQTVVSIFSKNSV
tara:strand:+ start:746 stop:2527 length:1782 start_codon:yes stop_codon:yes gene_type:complete